MSATASQVSPPTVTMTPPRAAPTNRETLRTCVFKALAVIRCSSATRVGSSDTSAATKNGVKQLLTATTTTMIQTWDASRTSRSGSRLMLSSTFVVTMTRRRSQRSTSTPATEPKSTCGAWVANRAAADASVEPVRA